MTTPFSLAHVVRAASPGEVVAAYFDAGLTTALDACIGLGERVVLSQTEDDAGVHRVSKVTMHRRLPAFLLHLVPGGITCREEVRWSRAQEVMTLVVQPQGRAGRARITSRIELRAEGGAVRWRHAGEVRVDVRLIGGRVERYLVDEFTASIADVVATTQAWLDARATAPAAAG